MDVFQTIRESLGTFKGEAYHLHQGKLYENPNPREDFPADSKFLIEPQIHSIEGGEKLLLNQIAELFLGSSDFANQITLSNGGTNALWLAFSALIMPSRPVVHVLSPYWMYLPGVIKYSGGEIQEISTIKDNTLKTEDEIIADVQSMVSERSSIIYVANPANPIGNVFSESFIARLVRICSSIDIHLVVDHAYYGFTTSIEKNQGLPPLPLVYRHKNVINAFTFSKLLGIPGLRLGFVQAPARIAETISEIYRNTSYTPNSYSQSVVYEYLKTPSSICQRQEKYKENLGIYESIMGSVGPKAEGGFFSFVPLPSHIQITDLLRSGVGVVEGQYFGTGVDQWIRICFTAEPPARLKASLIKLKDLLGEHYDHSKIY